MVWNKKLSNFRGFFERSFGGKRLYRPWKFFVWADSMTKRDFLEKYLKGFSSLKSELREGMQEYLIKTLKKKQRGSRDERLALLQEKIQELHKKLFW